MKKLAYLMAVLTVCGVLAAIPKALDPKEAEVLKLLGSPLISARHIAVKEAMSMAHRSRRLNFALAAALKDELDIRATNRSASDGPYYEDLVTVVAQSPDNATKAVLTLAAEIDSQ